MTPQQAEVARWMRAFGQEVPEKAEMPNDDVLNLRSRLIEEEATETTSALQCGWMEAEGPELIAEIADGLADLLVVTYGTAAAFGINIEPIFAEVMRSNWTKMWTTDEVNSQPDEFWSTHTNCLIKDAGWPHCWLVNRKNDGKVIKSPSYSPANLLPIIEAQMKGSHV